MTTLLILTLITDLYGFPLPETSQEFAHWSSPILTAEIGHEGIGIIIDYKTQGTDKRLWQKWVAGSIFTITVFQLSPIRKHYETEREWGLAASGFACWFGARLINYILHKKLSHKERLPTIIRLREGR